MSYSTVLGKYQGLVSNQIAKFMWPTCQPQVGPILAPWALLSGKCSSWISAPSNFHITGSLSLHVLWNFSHETELSWKNQAFCFLNKQLVSCEYLSLSVLNLKIQLRHKSLVSCQKGPTCHAYAWQIGPFWQDTLEICVCHNRFAVMTWGNCYWFRSLLFI